MKSMGNYVKSKKNVKAIDVCKCDYCEKKIEVGEEHDVSIYEIQNETYHWRVCNRCNKYVKEALNNKKHSFKYGLNNDSFHKYMQEEHPEIAKQWWEK